MNWENARYFLAVVRSGTFRGAARILDVDQATVGRRIQALEKELGARLFLHKPSGVAPTPIAEALIVDVESMEQAVNSIERQISGADQDFRGTIRISTTDSLGEYLVLPAMSRLRERHPLIDFVCSTTSRIVNLTRREADLAVRTVRPDAPDLIARRLGRLERGLYASTGYVAARGAPETNFEGHDLIVYQRAREPLAWETMCGEPVIRERIVLQCSSTSMLHQATLAGLGITVMSVHRAVNEPRLVRVLPDRKEYYDVWVVTHADLHRSSRVQAAIKEIAKQFQHIRKSL